MDGTFLTTIFKGILLLAAQKDANNNITMLCFAVCDAENASNWQWFVRYLYLDFPGINIIIVDKHKGLSAIWDNEEEETPTFSRCVKHMIQNMRNQVKEGYTGGNELRDLIYELAKAPSIPYYARTLLKIRFVCL